MEFFLLSLIVQCIQIYCLQTGCSFFVGVFGLGYFLYVILLVVNNLCCKLYYLKVFTTTLLVVSLRFKVDLTAILVQRRRNTAWEEAPSQPLMLGLILKNTNSVQKFSICCIYQAAHVATGCETSSMFKVC